MKICFISNCNNSGDPETPTIVGEWSISVASEVERDPEWDTTPQNKDFYTRFFAAQITNYEATTLGWIFWSWKTQLNDYRWSYSGMFRTSPARTIAPERRNVNFEVRLLTFF
jgi:hypothetical protein